MTITQQRLRTQRLTGPGFATPADAVRWFGAVQAQDYSGALWAVGMRTTGATERSVEQAVIDRKIVRSWPLRGTLHFTTPDDLRWMLKWIMPQTVARMARRFLAFELDGRTFARSAAVISKGLEGGRQLSRPAIYALLERAKISTKATRGSHILFRLAHDSLICFGARHGKQHTFALVDEWLPPSSRILDRDEALAELARRYFASHGPATLQDFTWWSGLLAGDARAAFELAGSPKPARGDAKVRSPHVVLLPSYDEYTVAYKDRSAALDPKHAVATRNGIFSPTILVDGRIAGLWSRRVTASGVSVALDPLGRVTRSQSRAIAEAAARYGRFVDRPVTLA
jgi:Winged helix DNA-binding domain